MIGLEQAGRSSVEGKNARDHRGDGTRARSADRQTGQFFRTSHQLIRKIRRSYWFLNKQHSV